jgi:hypothetical protein
MLKWIKHGKIFDPTVLETEPWMAEYAQLPFPIQLDKDIIRVYFATRPKKGDDLQYVSRSGYVDLSKSDIEQVVNISDKPILELGGPGSFDEFGSMTSSFVQTENKIFAYYTGWSRLQSVPYTMAIGMAVSENSGQTFEKISEGPILGQTIYEPFLLSGPIVKIIKDKWHMWYLNGEKWILNKGKYEPVYKLTHATSDDGIYWTRNGLSVMPSKFEDECQVSFALFHFQERWNAIFAYRQPIDFRENKNCAYRLGYAWSDDLESWHRVDSGIGLDLSASGWDSEMMAYPQVFEMDGRILLFYCGNNFGREGFGLAELILE